MKDAMGLVYTYARKTGLGALVEERTVASVPFGGKYRAVDFALSELVNAGITDVGVVVNEGYSSLVSHLGSGRDWDLNRKLGGLTILPPFGYMADRTHGEGMGFGKLDGLRRNVRFLRENRKKYVIIADGSVIANIDLDAVFQTYLDSGADIMAVCTDHVADAAAAGTYFRVDADRNITEITPSAGAETFGESMEIYIMERQLLLNLIDVAVSHEYRSLAFGLLNAMLGTLSIKAFPYSGFATRLKTVRNFFDCSMALLDGGVRRELFDRNRPIYTRIRDEMPAYYGDNSYVKNTVVTDGCSIEGSVENSVLFRRVRIAPGAVVKNCILMQGTVVGPNVHLENVICDKRVTVSADNVFIGNRMYPIVIEKGKIL